jgi:hypothetical protein
VSFEWGKSENGKSGWANVKGAKYFNTVHKAVAICFRGYCLMLA